MDAMQLDPEDYAFLTSYSPARVGKQAVALGRAVKGRLIGVVISLVIVLLLWWRSGGLSWPDGPTRLVLVLYALAGVAVAAVGLAAWRGASAPLQRVGLTWRFVLLGLAGLPLAGAWIVVAQLWRLGGLAQEAGGRAGLYPLVQWVYVVLVGLVTAAWLAAVVLGMVWARRPRSLGYLARWAAQVALVGGFATVGLGAIALLLARKLTPDMTEAMAERFAWIGDLGMWGLMALLCPTLALVVNAVVQTLDMTVFTARLVERPALRIDPLGLVIDEAAGPVRVHWQEICEIGAKAHTPLPGPELRLRRQGGPDWLVPFGFLDVMPGTIDSAIRAQTANQRALDLARLSRVW